VVDLKAQKMSIEQKIIEAHKLKFGSLPPLQQCSVSGSGFSTFRSPKFNNKIK
jgi:hypothetical protein